MAEPLSLCYLLPSLATGGAELQSLQQLAEWRRRGHHVGLILMARRNEPDLLARAEALGIPLCRLHGPSAVLDRACLRAVPGMVGPAAAFVRVHRFRTILAVMPAAHLLGRLVTLRLARAGQRLVLYRRSTEFIEPSTRTPAMRAYRAASDLVARVTDTGHIHVSAAVLAHNAAHGFTRRNLVLHNAVDFDRPPDHAAARALLARLGLPPGAWRLVIGGRLHRIKGHGFFLGVLRRLIDRQGLGPDALRLIVAGEGPERAAIAARIAALGLGAQVHLVGRQPNATLLGLFAAADLVVVPSLNEPFGNVAIEAQAVGTRLMASNSAGLDEIVRHGVDGWKFPAGDEAAAESVLTRLWHDRDRPVWDGPAVRALCRQRFALGAQIDALTAYLARPGL